MQYKTGMLGAPFYLPQVKNQILTFSLYVLNKHIKLARDLSETQQTILPHWRVYRYQAETKCIILNLMYIFYTVNS